MVWALLSIAYENPQPDDEQEHNDRLAQAGHTPERLETSATVTFQPGEGITKIALTVDGRVPGMSADEFQAVAKDAKENCPVSKALAGVPSVTLDANLSG